MPDVYFTNVDPAIVVKELDDSSLETQARSLQRIFETIVRYNLGVEDGDRETVPSNLLTPLVRWTATSSWTFGYMLDLFKYTRAELVFRDIQFAHASVKHLDAYRLRMVKGYSIPLPNLASNDIVNVDYKKVERTDEAYRRCIHDEWWHWTNSGMTVRWSGGRHQPVWVFESLRVQKDS